MKKLVLAFSVPFVAVVFSGCSKKNNGPSNAASVMFVNGCNGTTNIDTKVGNNKLNAASNMAYLNNSGYQTITAGSAVNINFYLTTFGTPLTNGSPAITANTHNTVFVGGLITGPSFVITSDDLTAPASGNAKVRFINLSSDNLNESFSVGTKLDSNIGYTVCTPYREIPATTSIGVSVVDPAHVVPNYLAQLSNQAFGAGRIYTIMLTGTSAGSGTTVLKLTVINNN